MAMFSALVITQAQTVIWSDNFDDEDVSDWSVYDEDGDGNNWADLFAIQDSNGNPVTPISIISRSWQSNVPLTPDNWIVSPAIDLSSVSGDITLSWKVMAAANSSWNAEHYTVYVANSTELADLEASPVSFTETYSGSGEQQLKTLDLSSLAGQTVYVAFRHYDCTDQDFISIDDVQIEGNVTAGVSDVNASLASIYPNPVVDTFNVSLSSKFNANEVQVTITDLTGKTVKTFGAVSSYNVADLAAGVYVVKITDGKTTETKKIVKK